MPGISVNYSANFLRTSALLAASCRSAECVALLAAVPGLDWAAADINKETALYKAVRAGSPDCVRILVSRPEVVSSLGQHRKHQHLAEEALLSGSVECVRLLAALQHLDWNVRMRKEAAADTPVMWALKKHPEMFRIIVKLPTVDLNIPDKEGNTPLMWALKNGEVEAVRALSEALKIRLRMMKTKLSSRWRGKCGSSAATILLDELAILRTQSQLDYCAEFTTNPK